MRLHRSKNLGLRRAASAFTLVEVVIASAIAAVTLGGIIYGYIVSATRAEWSAYSLAANSIAMQKLEQFRAAKWDTQAYPVVDEVIPANFPVDVQVLDIPRVGNNITYATNFTTIKVVSANPQVKMIRVDCVWKFMSRGLFTNTVATYRSPDQ